MMKGVTRSFWAVVAVAVVAEAFIGVLAIRCVESDLPCWISGLRDEDHVVANCGVSVAFVGRQNWAPAAAVLVLCSASVLVGLGTLISQSVRTRIALRRLGARLPSTEFLQRTASALQIEVQLCGDDRCFCCCAGLVFPKVIISSGMLELLDEGELTAVLAHEAAHVRRRDPARALAVRCAANALFYLPLARHLSKKALVASELGADSVAAMVAGRPALVRALLDVIGRVRPVLGTVSEMASLDSLDSRIEALRTNALPKSRPRAAIQLVSGFVLVGLLLLGAWLPSSVPHVRHAHVRPVTQVNPNS
jgi:beta-lactamase regulating signal transducer with metallopeptidase domain